MKDLDAIYKLVLRNLEAHNYAKLLPEAQEAMLREARSLISHSELPESSKKKITISLEILQLT